MQIFVLNFCFAAFSAIVGADCYLAHIKVLGRILIWVVPAILSMVSTVSFGLQLSLNGFGHVVILLGMFIFLYLFYRYLMAASYRMIQFYSRKNRTDYLQSYG